MENLDAHCAKVKTIHRTAALDPMLNGELVSIPILSLSIL